MSKIEVDAIDKQSGSTLTLGGSGTAVTLACGATQSGFGRTGTVDWQTGSIKTATFTAANGEGYFANTSGGAFTMNLPAGSAGAIVSVVDYTNTFQTNGLTISPNGAEKIGGVAAPFVASTEGQSLTFVYVDGTEGWKNVQDSTTAAVGNPNLIATGGTITTCGNCKIHTFTGPGTFTVSQVSTTAPENVVSYLVVASGGGGGGGTNGSGGGSGAGAGGFREFKSPVTPYTASPLVGSTPITVTAQGYPVVVGAGAAGGGSSTPPSTGNGTSGNVSSVFGIASAGGGGGRHGPCGSQDGVPGGSGSGASGGNPGSKTGGSGNTPPVSPSQGNDGGNTGTFPAPSPVAYASAGGGGAGGAGQISQPGPRAGGPGVATNITGSSVTYSAGGNGGTYCQSTTPISNAPDNSGNGGSGKSTGPGGQPALAGANGGSGIVVIRYKFQ